MSKLMDGYQTLIELANYTTIKLYEKTVKPPGFVGGGPIDVTDMLNSAARTQHPKSLYGVSAITGTFAYDPDAIDDIKAAINENQLITITFPDGAELDVWGWLDAFEPSDHAEGEQPTAQCTFEISNLNASLAETVPSFTSGTTTTT